DVGDDGDAVRFVHAAGSAARDPNTDALFVLLAPQAAIDPVIAAQGLCDLAKASDKPILACWLWGAAEPKSLTMLREAGILTFYSPEAAIRGFGYLWRHSENLRCLAELKMALADADEGAFNSSGASCLFQAALRSGRTVLTDSEARELFSAYTLP